MGRRQGQHLRRAHRAGACAVCPGGPLPAGRRAAARRRPAPPRPPPVRRPRRPPTHPSRSRRGVRPRAGGGRGGWRCHRASAGHGAPPRRPPHCPGPPHPRAGGRGYRAFTSAYVGPRAGAGVRCGRGRRGAMQGRSGGKGTATARRGTLAGSAPTSDSGAPSQQKPCSSLSSPRASLTLQAALGRGSAICVPARGGAAEGGSVERRRRQGCADGGRPPQLAG